MSRHVARGTLGGGTDFGGETFGKKSSWSGLWGPLGILWRPFGVSLGTLGGPFASPWGVFWGPWGLGRLLDGQNLENDTKLEAKIEPKSKTNLQKTMTKINMILGGCFSWILMISELMFEQNWNTFLHFFEKSKKLQNHCFLYGFGRFPHAKSIQDTRQKTTSETNAPEVATKLVF